MHGREPEPPHLPPADVIMVTSRTVACDGGGGPLGHPRVYLPIGRDGTACCPYCSRSFVLESGAAGEQGH
ncbi:MAG: zinc-finger domain-containing protein [Rhodospirillales bacterium]|nr:zinc-finger domain-containing protein [Rhodospirillales bacterium]